MILEKQVSSSDGKLEVPAACQLNNVDVVNELSDCSKDDPTREGKKLPPNSDSKLGSE